MCTEPESQKSIKLQSWANVIKCCVFMWISPDEIFPLLSVTCHFVPLRVFVLSSVKQTEVSPLEDNYRLSTKMAELNPARWYLSRWREHKKHTQAMVFSAQGPLPGIMIQLHVGMMDLVRNLVWDVQFYLMWLALWAFPGSSRIEKEMLNNRQPVPAPPFGGRSLHSKKSDEKGFVGLEIFWEVSKMLHSPLLFQKAALRDTSLLLEVLCKFSCLINVVRFTLPLNWSCHWEMSAWWLEWCVVLVSE